MIITNLEAILAFCIWMKSPSNQQAKLIKADLVKRQLGRLQGLRRALSDAIIVKTISASHKLAIDHPLRPAFLFQGNRNLDPDASLRYCHLNSGVSLTREAPAPLA